MQRCCGGLGGVCKVKRGDWMVPLSDPGVCSELRLGPYSVALWGLVVAVEGTACSWEQEGS